MTRIARHDLIERLTTGPLGEAVPLVPRQPAHLVERLPGRLAEVDLL
jgi:hypothetical protein